VCLLVEEYGSAQLSTRVNDPKYKKAVAIGTEVMVPLNFGRDQRYRRDLLHGIEKVSGERMKSRTVVTSAAKTDQKSTNRIGAQAGTRVFGVDISSSVELNEGFALR